MITTDTRTRAASFQRTFEGPAPMRAGQQAQQAAPIDSMQTVQAKSGDLERAALQEILGNSRWGDQGRSLYSLAVGQLNIASNEKGEQATLARMGPIDGAMIGAGGAALDAAAIGKASGAIVTDINGAIASPMLCMVGALLAVHRLAAANGWDAKRQQEEVFARLTDTSVDSLSMLDAELHALGMPEAVLEHLPGTVHEIGQAVANGDGIPMWLTSPEQVAHLMELAVAGKIAVIVGDLADPGLAKVTGDVLNRWNQKAGGVRASNVADYVMRPSRVIANLARLPLGDHPKLICSSFRMPEFGMGSLEHPEVLDLRAAIDGGLGERLDLAVENKPQQLQSLWEQSLRQLGIPLNEIKRADYAPPRTIAEAEERLDNIRLARSVFHGNEGVPLVLDAIRRLVAVNPDSFPDDPVGVPHHSSEVQDLAIDWANAHWTTDARVKYLRDEIRQQVAWQGGPTDRQVVPDVDDAALAKIASRWSSLDGLRWAARRLFVITKELRDAGAA